MSNNSAISVDLDRLLAVAAERGCACNKLFEGPCLAHYAERERDGGTGYLTRGFVPRDERKEQEGSYARPQSSPGTSNPHSEKQRTDAAVRGDCRGNQDRPAKPVRKGSGRKR